MNELIEQPVLEAQRTPEDPPVILTTPEEMERYAQLMESEYHEISPADRKKVRNRDIFYRVVHLYPQFTGIMETQFVAKVVVERYRKIKGPNGDLKQPHRPPGKEEDPASAEFHMKACEFLDKYRVVERDL